MKISYWLLSSSLIALLFPLLRSESMRIPEEGWTPSPSPLASESAEPGGRMRVFASQYPKSFNYYLDNNVFSAQLFGHQFETLIGRNSLTLDHEPALAERVEISEDKLTYTFTLHPDARWSDGTPVTAADVVWTFNAIMDENHLTGPHKVGLDKFHPPEAVDARTVRFTAKEVHWRNLLAVGGFSILPKHWWEKQDFNRVNFEFPVISGPYQVVQLNEPHSVVLRKREDYWARQDPRLQGLSNFQELEYLFYSDQDTAFDNFLRGEFDFFAVYSARIWVERTIGERFDQNWILKQTVRNFKPQGFQGFAMNLRRPLFQDVRVRRALAHLLDRERMNATLMHNQYELTASYFGDLYADGNPNPLILFDVEQARDLLREAGWEVKVIRHYPSRPLLAGLILLSVVAMILTGNSMRGRGKSIAHPLRFALLAGIPLAAFLLVHFGLSRTETGLMKDGERFAINFLSRDQSSERFLLIYREALEQVGIQLNLIRKDGSAWAKDMDEYNFDMTWAAWGAGLFKDPESMWHSRHVDTPSGNNITGFTHPEVDRLIDSTPTEFDVEVRHDIVRQIDGILVEHVPYILLWNTSATRILYWNRFGMPEHVLGKYGDERSSEGYWWVDPDLADDLRAARENGGRLPGKPAEVDFRPRFLDMMRVQTLQ